MTGQHRQHVLNSLELANGAAKLHALIGVLQGVSQCTLQGTRHLHRAHQGAFAAQALCSAGQRGAGLDRRVVKLKLHARLTRQVLHRLVLCGGQVRAVHLHQVGLAIALGHHHQMVTRQPPGDAVGMA